MGQSHDVVLHQDVFAPKLHRILLHPVQAIRCFGSYLQNSSVVSLHLSGFAEASATYHVGEEATDEGRQMNDMCRLQTLEKAPCLVVPCQVTVLTSHKVPLLAHRIFFTDNLMHCLPYKACTERRYKLQLGTFPRATTPAVIQLKLPIQQQKNAALPVPPVTSMTVSSSGPMLRPCSEGGLQRGARQVSVVKEASCSSRQPELWQTTSGNNNGQMVL